MLHFLGLYENSIDKKGRVSVPARFRAALEKRAEDRRLNGTAVAGEEDGEIYAFRSPTVHAIEVCELPFLLDLHKRNESLDYFSQQRSDNVAFIGPANPLSIDATGRIQLPDHLIRAAGLSERVVFVGQLHTFQIWDPARFEEHQAAIQDRQRRRMAAEERQIEGGAP